MTVKSAELTLIDNRQNIDRTKELSWNANYTLVGTELSVETVELFDLPGDTMITSLVLYHEGLGDVTLSVGTEADPDGLIQSELATGVGSGFLGQGVSAGIAPSSTTRRIVCQMTLNSGAYTAGADIQVWATGVRVI